MKGKNEVTVGISVVLGIIIAVAGALWLKGGAFGAEQRTIRARFNEVGELNEGNPVKFRGVEVGQVTGIAIGDTGEGVVVTMEVDPEKTADIPPDAAVLLASASLFGDWQAAIVSPSAYPEIEFIPGNPAEDLLAGATLPDITQLTAVGARIAENMQTIGERVELAFTEETALQLRASVEGIQDMIEQFSGFAAVQMETYDDVSRNALEATENITRTTTRFERVAGEVEAAFSANGRIQLILANVEQASRNFEELSTRMEAATADVPTMVLRADTTLAQLGALAASATVLLNTLEPQIAELGPTIVEARQTLAIVQRAASGIENGDGTLGRLLEDPLVYEEMLANLTTIRRILADIQANPERWLSAVKIF